MALPANPPWAQKAHTSEQQHSPAAQRNGAPILAELFKLLPPQGRALEIASGTGQHAALMASALTEWQWQPSDAQSDGFGSIAVWCREAGAANVLEPLVMDVLQPDWTSASVAPGPWDAIYCANMLHISPWATCPALLQGASQRLAPQGLLLIYGPFLQEGVPTAPGNVQFDADLRARNPQWGVRSLQVVCAEAERVGLRLKQRVEMPANNLLLVFD